MNKIKIGFIMLLSFMLACQDSEDSINDEISIKTDEVVFNLSVDVSKDEILTYAAASRNENWIDGLYVLYFDSNTDAYSNGVYIDGGSIQGNGTATPTFSTKVRPLASNSILLLANTGKTTDPNGLMRNKKLDDVNSVFSASVNMNQSGSTSGRGLPMASFAMRIFNPPTGTNANTPISVDLVRSVTKVQVNVAANLPTPFSNLANVSYQYRNLLSPTSFSIYGGGGKIEPTFSNPNDVLKVTNTPGASLNQTTYYLANYFYATRAKNGEIKTDQWSVNRMHLIINANGQFYRIDFARNSNGKQTYIDMDRNTNIVLTIKSVKAAGYATANQASAMPGNNLECDINVTSDNSSVIKSNGQYATLLSNDGKLIVGPSGTYDVSTVKYQMANGLSSASLTGVANKVELIGVTSTIAELEYSGPISTAAKQIKLKVKDNTTLFNAAIVVTLGNIKDTILVERHPISKFDVNSTYEITGSMLGSVRWLDNAAKVNLSASSSKIALSVPLLTGRKAFLQGVSKGVLHGRMKSKLTAYAGKTASSISLEIYKETFNKVTIKTNAPVGGTGLIYYNYSNVTVPINGSIEYIFRTGEVLQVVTARTTDSKGTFLNPIGWNVNGTRVDKDSPAGIYPTFDYTIPYVTQEPTNVHLRLHQQIVADVLLEAIYKEQLYFRYFAAATHGDTTAGATVYVINHTQGTTTGIFTVNDGWVLLPFFEGDIVQVVPSAQLSESRYKLTGITIDAEPYSITHRFKPKTGFDGWVCGIYTWRPY